MQYLNEYATAPITQPMTLEELNTTTTTVTFYDDEVYRVWKHYMKTVGFEYEPEPEEDLYDGDDEDSFYEEYYNTLVETDTETESDTESKSESESETETKNADVETHPGWTKQADGWLVKVGKK